MNIVINIWTSKKRSWEEKEKDKSKRINDYVEREKKIDEKEKKIRFGEQEKDIFKRIEKPALKKRMFGD